MDHLHKAVSNCQLSMIKLDELAALDSFSIMVCVDQAIRSGFDNVVRKLIPLYPGSLSTLLMYAILQKRFKLAQWFLDQGVTVAGVAYMGSLLATQVLDAEAFQWLFNAGLDLTLWAEPLVDYAIRQADVPYLERLIQLGCTIPDANDKFVLVAAATGKPEMLSAVFRQLYLQNPDTAPERFDHLQGRAPTELVKEFRMRDISDLDRDAALDAAVLNNNPPVVPALCLAGTTLAGGYLAYSLAIRMGYADVLARVSRFAACDAQEHQLRWQDIMKEGTMHAKKGNLYLLQILHGISTEIMTSLPDSWHFASAAACGGHKEVLQWILAQMVENEGIDLFEHLFPVLQCTAVINRRDLGALVWDVLVTRRHREPHVDRLMRLLPGDAFQTLPTLTLVRLLLDFDFLDKAFTVEYALIQAADHNQIEVVEYLISIGVDLQTDCNQALRYAAEKGYREVQALLISRGANAAVLENMYLEPTESKSNAA